MENYSGEGAAGWDAVDMEPRTFNPDHITSRSLLGTVKIITSYSLLAILVVGLILISYLIYRKHKGEEGLWKKILKWDLIFFAIIFIIWCIVSLMFLYTPSVKPANI